jgi:hypothetical protein
MQLNDREPHVTRWDRFEYLGVEPLLNRLIGENRKNPGEQMAGLARKGHGGMASGDFRF